MEEQAKSDDDLHHRGSTNLGDCMNEEYCLTLTTRSQSTFSNSSTLSDQPSQNKLINGRFRKLPEPDSIFPRSSWNENRQRTATCSYCEVKITSNMIQRLVDNINICDKIDPEIKAAISDKVSGGSLNSVQNYKSNLVLTAMVVENNLPTRMVESRSSKEFVKILNNNFRAPTRCEISRSYIQKLALEVETKFSECVKNSDDYQLSIEFDHWRDISARSILGIVAKNQAGSRYLLDLEEVYLIDHSANSIINSLQRCLQKVPARKINAFISDSASACKAARSRLRAKDEYCHVIEHRCLVHLNRMGLEFSSSELVGDLMKSASSLTNFTNDIAFLAKLKAAGINRLKAASKVRWFSNVNRLESLVEVRGEALRHVQEVDRRDKEKLMENLILLENDIFWRDIRKVLRFFAHSQTALP